MPLLTTPSIARSCSSGCTTRSAGFARLTSSSCFSISKASAGATSAKKVRRLEGDARNARTLTYVAAFFNVAMWSAMFFVVPAWEARIGTVLALLGWAYLIQQVTTHSRRAVDVCLEMADMPVVSYARETLERERSFFSGTRFWLRWLAMVGGPVVFCLGIAVAYRLLPALLLAVVWIALSALGIPRRNTKVADIQKQLDELQLYEGRQP